MYEVRNKELTYSFFVNGSLCIASTYDLECNKNLELIPPFIKIGHDVVNKFEFLRYF